jgi:hypothetical protein
VGYTRKLSGILAISSGFCLLLLLQAMLQWPQSSAGAKEIDARPPTIALEPASLTTAQLPDSFISQSLTIHNLGDEALAWQVYENVIPIWDQTDNESPGNRVPSQYFPDPKLQAGGFAADDFIVPAGQTWQVDQILIPGVYADNDEQAPNFDVTIYGDDAGMPGTLIVSATIYPISDISGEVTLNLTPPLSLSPGTYWLSVNANALFGASQTQWFWRTRTIQTGSPYHWLETSGIFATPCVNIWQPGAAVCGLGGGVDPDLLFRLQTTYLEPGCDSLSALPWVNVNPLLGNLAAGSTATLTVSFDSSGYMPGVYTGTLCIASNDPGQNLAAVSLTMTVLPSHFIYLPTIRQ